MKGGRPHESDKVKLFFISFKMRNFFFSYILFYYANVGFKGVSYVLCICLN